MTRHIDVYFYKASKRNKDEHIVNLITTFLDPPYCHCEVQFMDSKALAVYANQRVSMRVRDYDMQRYVSYRVYCSEQAYHSALAAACAWVDTPFSWWSVVNCHLKFTRSLSSKCCCSEICCAVLQAGRLLNENIVAAHVSPSSLYRILSHSCNVDSINHCTEPLLQTGPVDALDWCTSTRQC